MFFSIRMFKDIGSFKQLGKAELNWIELIDIQSYVSVVEKTSTVPYCNKNTEQDESKA